MLPYIIHDLQAKQKSERIYFPGLPFGNHGAVLIPPKLIVIHKAGALEHIVFLGLVLDKIQNTVHKILAGFVVQRAQKPFRFFNNMVRLARQRVHCAAQIPLAGKQGFRVRQQQPEAVQNNFGGGADFIIIVIFFVIMRG